MHDDGERYVRNWRSGERLESGGDWRRDGAWRILVV
jgi:hypothetical protein